MADWKRVFERNIQASLPYTLMGELNRRPQNFFLKLQYSVDSMHLPAIVASTVGMIPS